MKREVKEFYKDGSKVPEVVIMDLRDVLHGCYSVERLVGGYGYATIFYSTDLQECIEKATRIFEGGTYDENQH